MGGVATAYRLNRVIGAFSRKSNIAEIHHILKKEKGSGIKVLEIFLNKSIKNF